MIRTLRQFFKEKLVVGAELERELIIKMINPEIKGNYHGFKPRRESYLPEKGGIKKYIEDKENWNEIFADVKYFIKNSANVFDKKSKQEKVEQLLLPAFSIFKAAEKEWDLPVITFNFKGDDKVDLFMEDSELMLEIGRAGNGWCVKKIDCRGKNALSLAIVVVSYLRSMTQKEEDYKRKREEDKETRDRAAAATQDHHVTTRKR